jgi:inner membrane protein
VLSITHLLISTAAVSVALGTADPGVLGMAAIASQLPDLDKADSFIGRLCPPLSQYIEQTYSHRTITHSFVSTLALAIATAPIILFWEWQLWAALVIGQFLGWFADAFTRAGVAAFWPNPIRMVIPGNPKSRLRSGSTYEYWVMAFTAIVLVLSTNLASSGGVTEQFARNLFQDSPTAAKMFQRYGASQVLYVQVWGLHGITSEAIVGESFEVLDATESDLIAEHLETHELYKIGGSPDVQIRPQRVMARLGEALTIEADEYGVESIGINELLGRSPPDAYISGALTLEGIDEVRLPGTVTTFPSLRLFGGQVQLREARPDEIRQALGGFWVETGKVVIKTRTKTVSLPQ